MLNNRYGAPCSTGRADRLTPGVSKPVKKHESSGRFSLQSPNGCASSSSHCRKDGTRGGPDMEDVVVGIDVSKAQLDTAFSAQGEVVGFGNDEKGISQLLERLSAVRPSLVVMEASGGYETTAAAAIAAAGWRLAIVNPRQVREFARATGCLAKNDRIDAKMPSAFGAAIEPRVTRQPQGHWSRHLRHAVGRVTRTWTPRSAQDRCIGGPGAL